MNVRIVAATNRNLPNASRAGEFREDLLYRLRVIQIVVPPLRERRDDIPSLVEHFLGKRRHAADRARRRRCRRWCATDGRATSASCRTSSSRPSGSPTAATIRLADCPNRFATTGAPRESARERRRQVADQLFEALVQGHYSFWEHVYPLFLRRDLTRHDMRELVCRGLSATRGNYRALLKLFGMTPRTTTGSTTS